MSGSVHGRKTEWSRAVSRSSIRVRLCPSEARDRHIERSQRRASLPDRGGPEGHASELPSQCRIRVSLCRARRASAITIGSWRSSGSRTAFRIHWFRSAAVGRTNPGVSPKVSDDTRLGDRIGGARVARRDRGLSAQLAFDVVMARGTRAAPPPSLRTRPSRACARSRSRLS
jgi:hypothetical protein